MSASLFLSLALLAPSDGFSESFGDTPTPDHVVFILMDTTRADRLGFYRSDRETTPFLSGLARDGVVFERCRSQAPWTKPSMASMLTSRYPSEVGVTDLFQVLSNDWMLLPEALQKAGWKTAGFSTNPLMGAMSNYIQGFDHFVESTKINQGDPIRFASGAAAKVNQHVFPWLETTDPEASHFLYVHVVDPHEEYEPAPEFLEVFADPERHPQFREEWEALKKTRPPVPGLHVTAWNFEKAGVESGDFMTHAENLYDADILACDSALKQLHARVTETWGTNILWIVTSDHGEEFFEHGGTGHGYSIYDELVHVPLMLHWPGVIEARRVDVNVQSLDIYPTLCELVGARYPKSVRGASLVPLMKGEEWPARPSFSEIVEDTGSRLVGEPMGIAHGVVDGRFKLIRNLRHPNRRERPIVELFDVLADPGEQRNVADQHPEVAERLRDLVERWTVASLGLAAPIADDIDPETLAQLEALGYGGGGEEESGLPSDGGKLPLLARAVLEGAERWYLYGLKPGAAIPEDVRARDLVGGRLYRDRGLTREGDREELMAALYHGFSAGQGELPEGFAPIFGLRARYHGHIVDVSCDYETGRVEVQLDGHVVAELVTAKTPGAAFRTVFERRRVDIE